MHKCYLCECENIQELKGSVRDYPHLKILKCKDCGLVFLDNFDHISDVYYENSKMLSDANLSVDKWEKENYNQNKLRAKLLSSIAVNKLVLDFGCGEGGLLANIKPFVKACAGVEQSKILRERIVNKHKIQVFSEIEDVKGKFDIITLFHVIEHLKTPIEDLIKFKENLADENEIIIETPNSDDALLSFYKSKPFSNFTYWGCHVFLFTTNTLQEVARKAGFKVNYIKQIQRYSISNHLHWLAKGKPDGHRIWNFLDSPELNEAYENTLSRLGIADTLLMSISKE